MTRHFRVSLQGNVSPRTMGECQARAISALTELDRLNGLSHAFVVLGVAGLSPTDARRLADVVNDFLAAEGYAP